ARTGQRRFRIGAPWSVGRRRAAVAFIDPALEGELAAGTRRMEETGSVTAGDRLHVGRRLVRESRHRGSQGCAAGHHWRNDRWKETAVGVRERRTGEQDGMGGYSSGSDGAWSETSSGGRRRRAPWDLGCSQRTASAGPTAAMLEPQKCECHG